MAFSGFYAAATRIFPDHPGCFHRPGTSRINTAVLNFPILPYWPPGAPMTFTDVPEPGSTRNNTLATRCRILSVLLR
ncbi:hypothetical protein DPMN_014410 [Dreissena polymorpha]|uniref:Uncharacterized protein n=1 Tax=Dreissena polymorpha TaxID=45954 RepID=A0A9D4N5Y9_DREPO|nr:hypothetical protein DPMN_014410 [Dreissena polymorpha]